MEQSNSGNNGVLITLDGAKSKISVALTKVGLIVQSFHTRAAALILNDDPENLETVKKFLSDKKEAVKVTEETHKIIKKPFFDSGKACDLAKNETIALLDEAANPVEIWYKKTCDEIDRKQREADEKKQKEINIKAGVEANILDFSTKIAACKTKKELTDVERLINLEKSESRTTKYGDLHEFAKNRYNDVLLPIIKDQKVKVDEYEKLQAELKKAADADNPQKIDEINEKLQQKENEILQNQVKVQESALNQQQIPTTESEVILPDLTSGGSVMTCEIVDVKKIFTKHPELLNIELKLAETKKVGAMLRDAGNFDANGELIFDGIKFKIEKKWK